MIYGTGIDIVEVERIRRKVDAANGFSAAVFTDREIAYCEAMGKQKYQSYAARFAAKEAFLKAIGTGWVGAYAFTDIEVVKQPSGQPEIMLHGALLSVMTEKNITRCHLSLTHITKCAVAQVILETT